MSYLFGVNNTINRLNKFDTDNTVLQIGRRCTYPLNKFAYVWPTQSARVCICENEATIDLSLRLCTKIKKYLSLQLNARVGSL